MSDPREAKLEALVRRKAALLDQPFTPEAGREVEAIDAEIESIWDDIEAEVRDGTP